MDSKRVPHDAKEPHKGLHASQESHEDSLPEQAPGHRPAVADLQRVVGNQGVQRLMAQGKVSPQASTTVKHVQARRTEGPTEAEPIAEELEAEEEQIEMGAALDYAGAGASAPPDDNTNNAETPDIQRMPNGRQIQRKGSVGGGISTTGVKFSPEVELYKNTKKTQYVDIDYELGLAGEVEMTWSEDPASIGVEGKAGGGAKEGAMKTKIPVWQEEAKKEADKQAKSLLEKHVNIVAVDVELEAPKFGSEKEDGGSKGSSSMGVTLVLKSEAGSEYKPFVSLYSSETKGGETDISGPGAGIEVAIQLTPTDWKGAPGLAGIKEISGKVQLKGKLTFKPNYAQIAKKGIEKYGEAWVRRFAAHALQRALAAVVYSPVTFAVGALVSVAATWAALNDAQDIKDAANAAVKASWGYRSGFMAGIGVPGQSGGDATWMAHGMNIGKAAMGQVVTTILADPEIQSYGFTEKELTDAIRDKVKEKQEWFSRELYNAVDPKIKALAVRKWREYKKSLWWYPDAYVDKDEKYLRTRLGLPMSGPLDEGSIPEPSAPPSE